MNKVFYNFLLYLTYFGFNLEDILHIGNPLDFRERAYIAGIPIRDITLLLMLGVFAFKHNEIFKIIKRKPIILYVVAMIFFSLQGLLINGYSIIGLMRGDQRVLLWFLGGISFCFLLIKTGKVKLNLQIIVALTTFFLVISTFQSEAWRFGTVGLSVYIERIYDYNIFIFSGFLFTPLILLFNIERISIRDKVVSLSGVLAIVYCGAYLSNTRSMAFLSVILIGLYALSINFRNNGFFLTQIKLSKAVIIGLILCCIGAHIIPSLLGSEPRLERLLTITYADIQSNPRYSEVQDFLEQSGGLLALTGEGLGAYIYSSIYNWGKTRVLHVGIFNFWLKFGILPFLLIIFFLYFRIPFIYLKTVFHYSKVATLQGTANVVVLSSLFLWIASLAMSGGFAEVSFLFAGFAYLMYGEICQNGLSRILKIEVSPLRPRACC